MTDDAETIQTDKLISEEERETQSEFSVAEPKGRRIFSKAADPTMKVLYDRYMDDDLILQPDLQRYFVWDHQKSIVLLSLLF